MAATSLLKSAAAAAKKVKAYQDQYAAYVWDSSAQTYDDFKDYTTYLDKRQSGSTDPSDQLTIQGKIKTAQRSYTSNEIQRATQDIQQGNGSTLDKMNLIKGLWQQAIDNGDYNLGQNLVSQYNSLSIQLQNEQTSAASQLATGSTKAQQEFQDALTKGIGAIQDPESGNLYVELPGGQLVRPLADLTREITQNGANVNQESLFKSANDTLEALGNTVIDSYNNATTQDQIDSLESKYGPGLRDLNSKLTFDAGGTKLTIQDVVNAEANAKFNNPLYGLKATFNPTTGQTDYKLTKNNVDQTNYVRQFAPDGTETFVPAQLTTDQSKLNFGDSSVGRSLNAQITNEGFVVDKTGKTGDGKTVQVDESQTIGNRLKQAGIIATQNGTTLTIKLPGENIERIATIQPDGSVRYTGSDGYIHEVSPVDKNIGTNDAPMKVRAGQDRVIDPNEISDFGTTSVFGGAQSQASAQGNRYINDITGRTLGGLQTPASLERGRITGVGNAPGGSIGIPSSLLVMKNPGTANLSGYGTAATSALLQGASYQRQQQQVQAQQQQMVQAQQAFNLQGGALPNLNQTPVAQITSNGVMKSQLQVKPVAPAPVVSVQPVAAPKITSVGVNNAPTSGLRVR